jgi:hypothetical protein
MLNAARPLDEVLDTLTGALDDLDRHGQAIAALHLAMALDCLKSDRARSSAIPPIGAGRAPVSRGRLRLVM